MQLGLPQLPEWLLRGIMWLAVIGLLSVVAAICAGLYWLVSHLAWTA